MTDHDPSLKAVLTMDRLRAFMDEAFPQIHADGRAFSILEMADGHATLHLEPTEKHLRPGGTVSGPSLFALCDYAAYAVILAHIGPVALAVTTNLTMNFLRMPKRGRLVCRAEILKLGKRLAVIDARITDQDGTLVAQCNATYSIPPRR